MIRSCAAECRQLEHILGNLFCPPVSLTCRLLVYLATLKLFYGNARQARLYLEPDAMEFDRAERFAPYVLVRTPQVELGGKVEVARRQGRPIRITSSYLGTYGSIIRVPDGGHTYIVPSSEESSWLLLLLFQYGAANKGR